LFDPVYVRERYPIVGLAAIGMASAAIIACMVTYSSSVLRWALNWLPAGRRPPLLRGGPSFLRSRKL
jgi:hypothetical protein